MKEKFDYYDSGISSIMFVVLQYIFLRLYFLLPASVRAGAVSIIASCLLEGMFLLAVFITSRITSTKMIPATTLNKKVTSKGVLYSLAIAVVFLIFASPLTNVFASFLEKVGYKSSLGGIKVDNFLTYIIYIVVMCIIPAVTEEALFRGCIVGGLQEKNKHMAVFVGAIFFTLMHGGPDQTVHQFVMGVMAGYIFVYTKNLWYPIIIHFANNFMAVTMSYIYSGTAVQETTTVASWSQIGVSLVTAIVMAAAGAFILYFLIKELIKGDNKKENSTNDIVITTAGDEEQVLPLENKVDKRPKWLPIVCFSLSAIYLLFEWVATLLLGLGVV